MPGKNLPQTEDEMLVASQQAKSSRLYRAERDEHVDERLCDIVGRTANELQEAAVREPVAMSDVATVKAQTIRYTQACERAATLPSMAGLALALGVSRQRLYKILASESPPETARWLELCQLAFSDALANASLRGDVQPVVSIFLQKATFGLRETLEIVGKTEPSPLGNTPDLKALEERILTSVVDDE